MIYPPDNQPKNGIKAVPILAGPFFIPKPHILSENDFARLRNWIETFFGVENYANGCWITKEGNELTELQGTALYSLDKKKILTLDPQWLVGKSGWMRICLLSIGNVVSLRYLLSSSFLNCGNPLGYDAQDWFCHVPGKYQSPCEIPPEIENRFAQDLSFHREVTLSHWHNSIANTVKAKIVEIETELDEIRTEQEVLLAKINDEMRAMRHPKNLSSKGLSANQSLTYQRQQVRVDLLQHEEKGETDRQKWIDCLAVAKATVPVITKLFTIQWRVEWKKNKRR